MSVTRLFSPTPLPPGAPEYVVELPSGHVEYLTHTEVLHLGAKIHVALLGNGRPIWRTDGEIAV